MTIGITSGAFGWCFRLRRYATARESFGAQWVRAYGNVDEMYRTLSLYEVTSVRAVDRKRVWG